MQYEKNQSYGSLGYTLYSWSHWSDGENEWQERKDEHLYAIQFKTEIYETVFKIENIAKSID